MELATATKIAGGVVAAAVGTTGSVFLYKHITGLYSIEKVAAYVNDTWTVGESSEVANSNKKSWKLDVSISNVKNDDYKITDGSWICTVIGTVTTKDAITDDSAIDKTALRSQIYDKVKKIDGTDTNKDNRVSFVNSCSRNRKDQNQTNNVVVSEVKLDLKQVENKWRFDEDQIKTVFAGTWKNKK